MKKHRLLRKDVALLRCPHTECRGRLDFHPHRSDAAAPDSDGELVRGHLSCPRCRREYGVEDGIPRLVDDSEVTGSDRLLRYAYDAFAPFHDPAASLLLPLLQCKGEAETRESYVARLELGSLERRGRRPVRVLEIGVGGGANLPFVERALTGDVDVELWGTDLSAGMLRECARRLARGAGRRVRLVQADAHALPFSEHSFDRVFHSGGIGSYRDPARALAEMGRVAHPDTPIVVVDEQLDPGARLWLSQRLAFRVITLLNPDPRAPRDHLPADAYDVLEEQASPFYYSLRFRIGSISGGTPSAAGR